jgi:hypothetical protein
MASYGTQATITPAELADADDADALISATEARVRATLDGADPAEADIEGADPAAAETRGETVIGWLARIEGSRPGGAPGTQRPARWVSWTPETDEVPDGADLLSCRGRRTV